MNGEIYRPTVFFECNALLSMQEEDEESVEAALSQLNESELGKLANACKQLYEQIVVHKRN
jgi:hypothetical protein